MHYIDEGHGPPVVMLHGEPSWSYLYREIMPHLTDRHRVIAPDHMGFGKSETPDDRNYDLDAHVENLTALLDDLDLTDITLVVQDWGGLIGGGFALRHPDRIGRLVVMNAALGLGLPVEAELLPRNVAQAGYFQWMTRLHASGIMETVLGEFATIIAAVMKTLQGVERNIDQTWARAYGAPFATVAECRGAIALPRSIVAGTLRPEPPDAGAVAALRAKPAMMIYGMKDRVLLPHFFIPCSKRNSPGRRSIVCITLVTSCRRMRPRRLRC